MNKESSLLYYLQSVGAEKESWPAHLHKIKWVHPHLGFELSLSSLFPIRITIMPYMTPTMTWIVTFIWKVIMIIYHIWHCPEEEKIKYDSTVKICISIYFPDNVWKKKDY